MSRTLTQPRPKRPGSWRTRSLRGARFVAPVLAGVATAAAFMVGGNGAAVWTLRGTCLTLFLILVAARLLRRPTTGNLWEGIAVPGDPEEQYRRLIDDLPMVTYVESYEQTDHRIHFSRGIEGMLGWPPSRWSAGDAGWADIVHPEDRDRVLEQDDRSNQTGEPFAAEYRTVRADGSVLWVHSEAVLIKDRHGIPQYWQGAIFDITEQRVAQQQLQEAERRYRAVVEHMPAVSYIDAVDPENAGRARLVYVSPQLQAMFGYAPEEWIGDAESWRRALHPDDRRRVLAQDARACSNGETFSAEYRIMKKDGEIAWVHDESIAVPDEHGEVRFWQGVLFDITERKQAQEGLERALSIEREATRRLREIDAIKNTFLHAVSHELRTPLAAILGFAVTLEHHHGALPEEETMELTRRLAANARKLDRLLSDLLDLDRLDRGIVEPKWRPTDVGALVRHVVQESDLLVERPLRIEADPVLVSVDPAKVERIVENLLANTARHTSKDTPVWVWVRAHDGGVLIVVEDAGPGVPPELRETIFRPFEQGPDRSTHSPGVGIGLSLVGRFAKLHGGKAWVEERPGGGASFRIWLPDGGAAGEGRSEYPGAAEPGDSQRATA
jgi:PAS domain S-box-containing protein